MIKNKNVSYYSKFVLHYVILVLRIFSDEIQNWFCIMTNKVYSYLTLKLYINICIKQLNLR